MAPFPDVPGHVFDPKRTGAKGKSADGRAFRIAVVDLAVAPGEDGIAVGEIRQVAPMFVIAPGISPSVGSTRGIFPFGFGR